MAPASTRARNRLRLASGLLRWALCHTFSDFSIGGVSSLHLAPATTAAAHIHTQKNSTTEPLPCSATPAAVAMAAAAHERSLSLSRRNSLAPSLRASLEESFGYNSANSPSSLSSMARQRTRSMSAHDSMLLEGSVEPEALNERAIRVIHRVDDKLTGREFGKEELSVSSQVQRLIEAATAHQNLCQCFVGWCPFW